MSVIFGEVCGFRRLSALGYNQLQPREVILVLELDASASGLAHVE